MNLAGVDLNLLVALGALLEERSVTKAAARTGVSQPAMSHSLARLRELVGDPLLVRTAKGMAPTPRARELEGPLREALSAVERVLEGAPSFEPASSRREFALASADYAELVLLPRLASRLGAEAPGVALEVRTLSGRRPGPDLESGRVGLAVGAFTEAEPGLYRKVILRERMVCVLRRGHPAEAGLDLERFVALPHLLVAPRGGRGGLVDQALAERGLARRVALSVPHFLVAGPILEASDLVATLPERMARFFAERGRVTVVEPPLPIAGFAIAAVWHERTHACPAHRWLRERLAEVGASA